MIDAILIAVVCTALLALGLGGYLGYTYGRRVEQKAHAAVTSTRAALDAIKKA